MSALDKILDHFAVAAADSFSNFVQNRQADTKHELKGLMLDIIGPHRPNCAVNTPGLSQLTMDNVKRGRQEECSCGVFEMGRRVASL